MIYAWHSGLSVGVSGEGEADYTGPSSGEPQGSKSPNVGPVYRDPHPKPRVILSKLGKQPILGITEGGPLWDTLTWQRGTWDLKYQHLPDRTFKARAPQA